MFLETSVCDEILNCVIVANTSTFYSRLTVLKFPSTRLRQIECNLFPIPFLQTLLCQACWVHLLTLSITPIVKDLSEFGQSI